MKTIILTRHGGPEVLELSETEKPFPQADEVLIRTSAIGINYANVLIRQGVYLADLPLPSIMLGEVEGVIEAVGINVKHLKPGQKVTGVAGQGYAEYVTIPAGNVYVLPPDLPDGHGLLAQGLTAWHLLQQSENYQSVLITAAAGGVGSFAVQLAKLKGVTNIIGLSGDKDKNTYVKSLGTTHSFSYFDNTWQEEVKQATGNKGVDLILDAIGGEIGTALTTQLSAKGTMITYGNISGAPMLVDGNNICLRSNRIIGASIFDATNERKQEWFNKMIAWIQDGKLQLNITFYPFEEVRKAYQTIADRTAVGKIVLSL